MSATSSPGPSGSNADASIARDTAMKSMTQNYHLGEDKKKHLIQVIMNQKMLYTLQEVGAVPKIYYWREVLQFFKEYLFKKKLIDNNTTEKTTVYCDEKLKMLFGVEEIVYANVISLILRESILLCCEPKIPFSSQAFAPIIPEPQSDIESNHSYQGYETEYCKNTTDEEFSESEMVAETFESNPMPEILTDNEFEPVTDVEENENVSDDSDEEVINVILEIPGTDSYFEDDNFADESDTFSECDSEDIFSDQSADCLRCHQPFANTNKPCMRYCLDCWKASKDKSCPDRPRHKKRKPKARTKKNKTDRPLTPGFSSDQEGIVPPCPSTLLRRSPSETSSSTAASQDSGFYEMSSQETGLEQAGLPEKSYHQDSIFSGEAEMVVSIANNFSSNLQLHSTSTTTSFDSSQSVAPEKASKKRKKSMESISGPPSKVLKISDGVKNKFLKFLDTRDGSIFFRESGLDCLLTNFSSDDEEEKVVDEVVVDAKTCSICYCRPVNASIIHGKSSHIAFCYPCAKKLYNSKRNCPLCRRKIHMVTKNFYE